VQTQEPRKGGNVVRRPWLLTILTAVAIDLALPVLGVLRGVHLFPLDVPLPVFFVLLVRAIEWVPRWLGLTFWYGSYVGIPLVFLLWQPRLLRGESRLPVRNRLLLSIGTVLSALYYASHWRQGLQHEGLSTVVCWAAVNVVLIALAVGLILRAYRRPSFAANLLSQGMLFLWLTTFAFPILGDWSKFTLCGDWCGR
jgi:hypothetical protein